MAGTGESVRPRLTVVILARDTACDIDTTIGSIRPLADEIVVVDVCTDKSVSKFADREEVAIQKFEWTDDFAAARNACLAASRGDWIFWMNAGESIDNLAVVQLRRFVEQQADINRVYLVYLSKRASTGGQEEQIGQIRLLPNNRRLNFTGAVRESLLPSVLLNGMEVDALDFRIDAPTGDCDAELYLRVAESCIAGGDTTTATLNAQAEALVSLGKAEEAEQILKHVVATAERGCTELLEAYYGLLTIYEDRSDNLDLQSATCLNALDIYPLDAQLLCGMGYYLLQQNRLELACRSYELAAQHGQVDPGTWHLPNLSEIATSCWALTLSLIGNAQRAGEILESHLEQHPTANRVRRQLIEMLVKHGEEQKAFEHLEMLPESPHSAALSTAVRGAVLVAKGQIQLGTVELCRAYNQGCLDPLCLRWLSSALLQESKFLQAEQVLERWKRMDPENEEIDGYLRALAAKRLEEDEGIRFDKQKTGPPASPRFPGLPSSQNPTADAELG